jgi:hypothetical protein
VTFAAHIVLLLWQHIKKNATEGTRRLTMADEIEYIEGLGYPPIQMRDAEIYGPLQRSWSNVNRGFAEDVESSSFMRMDARRADSRSRPLSKGIPKEDVDSVV